MLCIKLLSLFIAILCLMPKSQVTATIPFLFRCNYRCPSRENTIFATDGTNCFVYHNNCSFRKARCDRLHKVLPRLMRSTKEACQAKCKTTCGTEKSPVCGKYGDTSTTFENTCFLLKAACENGQGIRKVRNRACPVQG